MWWLDVFFIKCRMFKRIYKIYKIRRRAQKKGKTNKWKRETSHTHILYKQEKTTRIFSVLSSW